MAKILIIEDDIALAENAYLFLKEEGHNVFKALSYHEGVQQMIRKKPEIILTDLMLGDGSGLDILYKSREQKNFPDVILLTAHPTSESAVTAMNTGAYEYLTKPYKLDELRNIIRHIMQRRALVSSSGHPQNKINATEKQAAGLIIKDPEMKEIIRILSNAAPRNTTLLLRGESGTGKEQLARYVHQHSMNPEGPFVAINCGAIPENLVSSELFGHERGAFTGASSRHTGAFIRANNGTLLLDEIGDIPQMIQVHLLRVLENREVMPVGGTQVTPVNIRLIAATHQNLEQMIEEGKFREDLFFRLNVFPITIPPLRARTEEIPLMVPAFLRELQAEEDIIPDEVIELLKTYHWPGNIRELKNIVENLYIRAGDQPVSLALAQSVLGPLMQLPLKRSSNGNGETLAEMEMREIKEALIKTGGNKSRTASLLGISRTKLYAKIKMLGIEPE